MKKLGTPIGAGPGSENENVGLLALGTPLPFRGVIDGLPACGGVAFFFLCFFFLALAVGAGAAGCGWLDGFCPWLFDDGAGVVVVLLVVVELVDELLDELELEAEVEVEELLEGVLLLDVVGVE